MILEDYQQFQEIVLHIKKVNKQLLRIPLAEGEIKRDNETLNFTMSIATDGTGLLFEMDDTSYFVSTESIVKDIVDYMYET